MLDLWLLPMMAILALIVGGVYLMLRNQGAMDEGKSPLEQAREQEHLEAVQKRIQRKLARSHQ